MIKDYLVRFKNRYLAYLGGHNEYSSDIDKDESAIHAHGS